MKKIVRVLMFVLIAFSAFLMIDSKSYMSDVEAGVTQTPSNIRAEKLSSKSIKLTWDKVINISHYEIYAKNGEEYTLLKVIDDKETTSWVHENLDENKEYIYVLKTRLDDKSESYFSYWVSCYTGNDDAEYSNLKSISFVNAPKLVNVKSYTKLNVNFVLDKQDKPLINSKISWWTSNENIATIDENGSLNAHNPGEVKVYARGHNGVEESHTITVEKPKQAPKQVKKKVSKKVNVKVDTPVNIKADRLSSSSVKIRWDRLRNVRAYEIYQKKNNAYVRIATVSGNRTSYVHKHLKANREYAYRIKTVKRVNGRDYRSKLSYYVSSYTYNKRGKYTNLKSLWFRNKPRTLYTGSKTKIKIGYTRYTKKPLRNNEIRWWTTNTSVAKVDNRGNLRTYNPGKTQIYAKAHNGITVRYTITVKEGKAARIPILTFHRVVSDTSKRQLYHNDQWVASVKDYERQMKYLHDNKYRTISVEEFDDWYSGRIQLPKKTVMITFDDGDYELYHLVLPILKKYNFKATAFIVGTRTGKFTHHYKEKGTYFIGDDKIQEIKANYPNLRFESHSFNLHYRGKNSKPIIYYKSYNELNDDFKSNEKYDYNYMAFPYGAYTKDAIRAAKNNGIKMAFGFSSYECATRKNNRYEIPRIKINGQITYTNYVTKMQNYLK